MIAFRVDINKDIASGHIMRCITIAEKIRKKGKDVIFISGDEYCSSFLKPRNFEYVVTNTSPSDWDGEIEFVKKIIKKYGIEVLFADSYVVSKKYLEEINKVCKVAYIDDFLREQYDISLLLAPTQSRDLDCVKQLYANKNTILLLGREYLIIRDEFLDVYDGTERNGILVTTGGSDKYHFTLKLIRRIAEIKELLPNRYYIVLGSLNEDEESIREIAKNFGSFEILKNISNMGEYMHKSKYAISAGGNTVYELLCSKVPISCIALSDDQVALGKRFMNQKIVSYEGDCREGVDKVVENCIKTLLDVEKRGVDASMLHTVDCFTDGLGAERIADALVDLVSDTEERK